MPTTKRQRAKFILDNNKTSLEYPEFGLTLTIEIGDDDLLEAPWDSINTYGNVSEWRDKDSKKPGERILYREGRQFGKCHFYDFASAVQNARKQLAEFHSNLDGKTLGEVAANAAEFEFDYLRAWANDEWHFVYYSVTLHHEFLGEIGSDSCGGFDTYRAPGKSHEEAFAHINEAVRSACAELLWRYRKDATVTVNA